MSESSKRLRVALADVLVSSGLSPWRVLEAIGYPRCLGFLIHFQAQGNYRNKPDDDFAVRYVQRRRFNDEMTFPGADLQRNVGKYAVAIYDFKESDKLPHGDRVLQPGETVIKVYTFDGWAAGWAHQPWHIYFWYSDDTKTALSGGRLQTGTSSRAFTGAPDYYDIPPHFYDYYENGDCTVPAPPEWPLPRFMKAFQKLNN